MSKIGKGILAEMMVVPLGADPVQMRREQEESPGDDDGCDTPGEKKRSKGKGRGLARGGGKGPIGVPAGGGGGRPREKVSEEDLERIKKLEDEDDEEFIGIPIIALKTFKSFYVEGHTGVAAMMMADALGIAVGDEMEEEVEDEFVTFLEGGGPSQLAFLRRSMTKFDAFMNIVKAAWEKLSDSKKEQIAKVLKTKAAKMAAEVKNKASALDPKKADDVMMLATMAYMYGLGLPGEGAAASEAMSEEEIIEAISDEAKKAAFEFFDDIARDVKDAKEKARDWMGTAMAAHLRGSKEGRKYKLSRNDCMALVNDWASK